VEKRSLLITAQKTKDALQITSCRTECEPQRRIFKKPPLLRYPPGRGPLETFNELKNIKKEKGNVFWEYAGMDEEEYRIMYIQAAKDVVAKVLPEPKKARKAATPHGGDAPADASGAGSSSSKRKKNAKKDGIRKCRVCGCTETAPGNPRYLVGADICNVCEEDNYPFEPDEDEEEVDDLNLDGEDIYDVDNGDDDVDMSDDAA